MSKDNPIKIADLCVKHQSLLVHQAKYSPQDNWRILILATQISLFQALMSDKKTHEKIDGDVSKIENFGCLACYKPDVFGQIVEIAKKKDISLIKKFGDGHAFSAKAKLDSEDQEK